jgi:hypothetical protein
MNHRINHRHLAARVRATFRRLRTANAGMHRHSQPRPDDHDIEALAVSVGALAPVRIGAGRKQVMP